MAWSTVLCVATPFPFLPQPQHPRRQRGGGADEDPYFGQLRANRDELALHGLLLKKQQIATGPFPGLATLKSPWACLLGESAQTSRRLLLKYKTFALRAGGFLSGRKAR